MASSGQAITASFYAFIAATNLPKTGDSANMKAFLLKDGTVAVPAAAVAEVDATKAPGSYKVTLTGAENTAGFLVIGGTTSTAGVVILPTAWTNENLPTPAPGAAGGILIAGSNAATTVNLTGNLTGNVTGSVGSVTGAVGSVTGAVGSVTGAVGSVTGNVGGNVTGSVGSVLTGGLIDLTTTTYAESAAVPAATASLKDKIIWLATLARNKITCSASAETVYADDGTTSIGTASVGDTGSIGTRGKFG